MHLTPSDREKLLLATAGMVARDRLGRGVRLNYPETVALLSTWVIEGARDGRSVPELMEEGRHGRRCGPRCLRSRGRRPMAPHSHGSVVHTHASVVHSDYRTGAA